MGREELANRPEWQRRAAIRGNEAECAFQISMKQHLENSNITLTHRPNNFLKLYGQTGIVPNFMIHEETTHKIVLAEVTRQQAGGNAHERVCRYMMPGMLRGIREIANQNEKVIPIWWIFTDDVAADDSYRQKIQFWFRGIESHLLLWKNMGDSTAVIKHFEEHIRKLLS